MFWAVLKAPREKVLSSAQGIRSCLEHHAVQLFHGGHRSDPKGAFGKPGTAGEGSWYMSPVAESGCLTFINPETLGKLFATSPFAYVRDDKDAKAHHHNQDDPQHS